MYSHLPAHTRWGAGEARNGTEKNIVAISDVVVIPNIIIPAGDVGIRILDMRALVHCRSLISAYIQRSSHFSEDTPP